MVQYIKVPHCLNAPQNLDIDGKGCVDRPDGERGSWNAAGVKFYKPASLTSFAVASFVPEHRVSGGQDPGSIQVRCSSHTTDRASKHIEDSRNHRLITEYSISSTPIQRQS